MIYILGILKYLGLPALLSEEVHSLGKSIQWTWDNELNRTTNFWVLGASFNETRILSNSRIKCDEISCYEKSLSERKICKPGKL